MKDVIDALCTDDANDVGKMVLFSKEFFLNLCKSEDQFSWIKVSIITCDACLMRIKCSGKKLWSDGEHYFVFSV